MTSTVLVYGSGECEQLGLEFGKDDFREVKRPRKIAIFDMSGDLTDKVPIVKLLCGGMHTVALTSSGAVYSWGCNDDGALGRSGCEDKPMLVDLPFRATDISVGDSHSVFYTNEENKAYFTGLYRNALTGPTCNPVREPTSFGEETWKKNQLQKIVSGADHSLALCKNGKVFAWGDAESGKIGRMLNSRSKNKQAMKIESVGAKRAKDIFCGNHASFYLNDKGQLFAWGLNNHGQLGIGNKMDTCTPTYVYALDGIPVKEVAGGEHHTLCVTQDGRVFCWGRNDEGQCGVGDLFGKYRKEQAELELQKAQEVAQEETKEEPANNEKRSVRKQSKKEPKEKDLDTIYYFRKPNHLESLQNITRVFAGSNYCYALDGSSNQLYSWGMGYNYVLGNREEDNEFEPIKVHPKMFYECQVREVGTGSQHVVVLAGSQPGDNTPVQFDFTLELPKAAPVEVSAILEQPVAEPEVIQDIEAVAIAEDQAQEPEPISVEVVEEPIAVAIASPVHEQRIVEPIENGSEGGSGRKRMQHEISGGASQDGEAPIEKILHL